jgi:hypothetical protein
MNHRHRASRSSHPLGRVAIGLCSLLVLLLIASDSALAAGAGGSGGSVSYSIRLEVGTAGLQGGRKDAAVDQKNGSTVLDQVLIPNLRRRLTDRYTPEHVEEIIRDISNRAVVVIDGEGHAVSPSQETWVASTNGAVVSL